MNTAFGNVPPTSHGWTRFVRPLPVAATLLFALGLGLESRAQQSIIVAVPPDLPNLVGVGLGLIYSW